MTLLDAQPIACTLEAGEYKDRLASIRALNRDALRNYERRDLVLELNYEPEARERVREMVRGEQTCCSFLTFECRDEADAFRVTITAPEPAREAADALFEQFVGNASSTLSCSCASTVSTVNSTSTEPPGSKAAGVTAITLSTGAIACGACCVLPFTLPATVLASTGSLLAWFVHLHVWVTIGAIVAVIGAWAWIGWQIRRTHRKPATSTLIMMTFSTLFSTVAVLWPLIEKPIIRALRA